MELYNFPKQIVDVIFRQFLKAKKQPADVVCFQLRLSGAVSKIPCIWFRAASMPHVNNLVAQERKMQLNPLCVDYKRFTVIF